MRIFRNKSNQRKWGERKTETQVSVNSTIQPKNNTARTTNNTTTEPKSRKYHTVRKSPEVEKSANPDLQFQMMYGLSAPAEQELNGGNKSSVSSFAPSAVGSVDSQSSLGKRSSKAVKPIQNGTGVANTIFPKPIVYKKLVKKKLNIILIENTAVVSEHKKKIMHIMNHFSDADCVCVINYTDKINSNQIIDIPISDKPDISYYETDQKKACLYDALIELEKIVSSKYLVTEENENERVCIDNIEIIGIGTCRDNCSTATKQEALEAFAKVAIKNNITSKYYCITDEHVVGAAEIGFRSIGSIVSVFQ